MLSIEAAKGPARSSVSASPIEGLSPIRPESHSVKQLAADLGPEMIRFVIECDCCGVCDDMVICILAGPVRCSGTSGPVLWAHVDLSPQECPCS